MALQINNYSKLCVHTLTNKPWSLEQCVKNYHALDIRGITIWRNVLEGQDLKQARQLLNDHNMDVVSVARGGFFPAASHNKRQEAIDDNHLAIEQAAAVGAPVIVLVCGADSSQPLEKSRDQIREGIQKIVPAAKAAGIKLAIEPLHPMYAGDRSAINTLAQANTLAEKINSDSVGVAVDVYHLWWDNHLQQEIMRCGKNGNLFAFHVCDWNVPTTDFLNDRGLMGKRLKHIIIDDRVSCNLQIHVVNPAGWKRLVLTDTMKLRFFQTNIGLWTKLIILLKLNMLT